MVEIPSPIFEENLALLNDEDIVAQLKVDHPPLQMEYQQLQHPLDIDGRPRTILHGNVLDRRVTMSHLKLLGRIIFEG